LLGEDLIAFRDSAGDVGLVDAYCPHRRAPMFFGRNDEGGLRCVYHGWKFDCSGACVDMPSEPPESNFKDKVKIKAYPSYEAGGVIWIYMGPKEHQPDRPPEMPFTLVPEGERSGLKFLVESSFLQNLEGELDTAHVSFLHSVMDDGASLQNLVRLDGYNNDRHPRLTVIDTDYGFVYGGRRQKPNGEYYWRVTQYVLPFSAYIPSSGGYTGGATIWVPIDDHHCWRFLVGGRRRMIQQTGQPPATLQRFLPIEPGQYTLEDGWTIDTRIAQNNKKIMYGMDRSKRNVDYTGIPAIPTEDQAMNEGMGYICDRTKEHLGTTDISIIAMRRRFLKMIADLQKGIEPYAPQHPEIYRVRPLDIDSPDDDLGELLSHHPEKVHIPAGGNVYTGPDQVPVGAA
jgi:nitrite reductase/ring-hydroxylating ferredoxin subunit